MNKKRGILITSASIKKFLKYFIVVVLLLIPSILFIVSQFQVREFKKEFEELKHDHDELNTVFNDYKDVVSAFYEDYQDTGLLTVDVLEGTIERMESAIEVYDNNVDIYNDKFESVEARTAKLEESVQVIAKYLVEQ